MTVYISITRNRSPSVCQCRQRCGCGPRWHRTDGIHNKHSQFIQVQNIRYISKTISFFSSCFFRLCFLCCAQTRPSDSRRTNGPCSARLSTHYTMAKAIILLYGLPLAIPPFGCFTGALSTEISVEQMAFGNLFILCCRERAGPIGRAHQPSPFARTVDRLY